MMCFTYYLCIWIQYYHFLVLGCYQLKILSSLRLKWFSLFCSPNIHHLKFFCALGSLSCVEHCPCLSSFSWAYAEWVMPGFKKPWISTGGYCVVCSSACFVSSLVLCILTLFFFQALGGVYAKEVHVRLACLNAIKCVPIHSVQRDLQVSTSLWIAAHDPEKVCNSFPTKFDMELFY